MDLSRDNGELHTTPEKDTTAHITTKLYVWTQIMKTAAITVMTAIKQIKHNLCVFFFFIIIMEARTLYFYKSLTYSFKAIDLINELIRWEDVSINYSTVVKAPIHNVP